MPFEIVQSNSGGFNTTSGNATLPVGTTAGNTLILRVGTWASTVSPSPPTGFTARDSPNPGTNQKGYVYRKTNVGAGETSWAIGLNLAGACAWWIDEVAGLDVDASPVDATSAWTTATSTSVSTGTSTTTTAYDAVAFAVHVARDGASGTAPTWSGHTNGFIEQGEQGQAVAAGTSSVGMSVSYLPLQALGAYETTATASLSTTIGATVVVYAAAGSKRAASIAAMDGFERGTNAGVTTGPGGGANLYESASTTAPSIIAADSLATGNHCLELTATAAGRWLSWGTATLGSKGTWVVRFSFWFPSSLPAADLDLFTFDGDVDILVRFRQSSSKIGVQAGVGTEQLSIATVAADTRYDLDLRGFMSPTAATTCDWRLSGIDQTQAVGATATGANWQALTIGWTGASTATVRVDDYAVADVVGNYPLDDIRIYPLKVDGAGTITISGSTANFGVMTANGTVAAWNATNARAAIDDVPPTIGASADGLVATAAHATDYAEIPLETRQAAPQGSNRAVKVYLPMWAASGTAATCRVTGWDGTEAITLFAEADPNADNSTTTPAWIAKMYKPTGGWTQAKLDAAAIRFGSNDATPDIGPHAVLAEVAVQNSRTDNVIGETGEPTAQTSIDQLSSGVLGITVTTPPHRPTTLKYVLDGSPVSVPIAADTVHIETIDAVDITHVTEITLEAEAS